MLYWVSSPALMLVPSTFDRFWQMTARVLAFTREQLCMRLHRTVRLASHSSLLMPHSRTLVRPAPPKLQAISMRHRTTHACATVVSDVLPASWHLDTSAVHRAARATAGRVSACQVRQTSTLSAAWDRSSSHEHGSASAQHHARATSAWRDGHTPRGLVDEFATLVRILAFDALVTLTSSRCVSRLCADSNSSRLTWRVDHHQATSSAS